MRLSVRLDPRKLAIAAAGTVIALVAFGSAAMVVEPRLPAGDLRDITRALHLDREGNIPALVQALGLMLSAVLLSVVAAGAWKVRDRFARYWTGLAVIFAYLAFDEGAALHELAGIPVKALFETTGIFHFGWIVAGLGFVLVVGAAYTRFLLGLPRSTRRWFLAAAILYVGGALGVEMLASLYISETRAWRSLTYIGLSVVEEGLEMTGISVFIVAILRHLRDATRLRGLDLTWSGPASTSMPAAVRDPVRRPEVETAGAEISTAGRTVLWLKVAIVAALLVCTVGMLAVEFRNNQGYARLFFTDVRGPVMLYGINTTLSATLLWSVAVLFGVNLLFLSASSARRARVFYVSQVLIFLYLGLDDRFLLHERIGAALGFNDAFVLLGVGVLEVALLATVGELRRRPPAARLYLLAAAMLFAFMFFIDGFMPQDMRMRLSVEDLSKMWSGAFLFLFGYEITASHVRALRASASDSRTTTSRAAQVA